jgi:hypothetical protein
MCAFESADISPQIHLPEEPVRVSIHQPEEIMKKKHEGEPEPIKDALENLIEAARQSGVEIGDESDPMSVFEGLEPRNRKTAFLKALMVTVLLSGSFSSFFSQDAEAKKAQTGKRIEQTSAHPKGGKKKLSLKKAKGDELKQWEDDANKRMDEYEKRMDHYNSSVIKETDW